MPGAPPKAVKDYAKSYKCSHCRSHVAGVFRDARGLYHMSVSHDDTCPVLRGTLTDMHDAIRAAVAAGRATRLRDDPAGGGAE